MNALGLSAVGIRFLAVLAHWSISITLRCAYCHRQTLRRTNMHSTPIPSWSALLQEGALSRRHFLRAAAGTAGGILGASLLLPVPARADHDCILPKPIPGTLPAGLLGKDSFGEDIPPFPIHEAVGLADEGAEGTNITDFNGDIGVAIGGGAGTDSEGNSLIISLGAFKFTKGVYVGVDGKIHRGAFAFI
jgi:hypothetical protein